MVTDEERKELLEEAITRYPIGTQFRSAQTGREFTVGSGWQALLSGNVSCDSADRKHEPYLRFNGKWAEIISKPEPEIINNYSIY